LIREWVKQAAACHGSAVYLEDARGARTLSYAELWQAVQSWERRLDAAGLPPGSRIAICLSDQLEYARTLVALLGAGRVAVPLDPSAPGADVARVVAVAAPAAAIADPAFGLISDLPLLWPGVTGDGQPSAGQDSAGADGGIFLCTSGTTGTPKGILLRDEQLAHVAASVATHHRLTAADRGYCSLPLFHVNAEVVGLLATLRAGARLAVDRKFSRRGFWDLIEQRQITWINAVPAIISILAMDPPATRPGKVRFVRSASAPLPGAALERFESVLGIPVVETYGMTEAASMITANPLHGPRKPGSAGLPAGAEVRVVAPDGSVRAGGGPGHAAPDAAAPAPVGPAPVGPEAVGPEAVGPEAVGPEAVGPEAVGRVQIRGKGVIRRYAEGGRPGAIDPAGWLDTGDLGYLDADGYLFLVGRSDDVINRGGEKIYPREIEEILLAQPGVRSAAVVGAADDVLGECPVAYVVPDDEWPAEKVASVLREACQAELPRHKQPSAFCLVDELPLGPTGKIARYRLRDLVTAQRCAQPSPRPVRSRQHPP
jgi:oxalate---CoA ligase